MEEFVNFMGTQALTWYNASPSLAFPAFDSLMAKNTEIKKYVRVYRRNKSPTYPGMQKSIELKSHAQMQLWPIKEKYGRGVRGKKGSTFSSPVSTRSFIHY